MNSLIILIGPSASGKSTIANTLKEEFDNDTAVFDFDIYRENFLNKKGDYYPVSAQMLTDNILTALDAGYDVIVDGFYRVENYPSLLDEVIEKHASNNYIFYFDVSLETTIKRHAERDKRDKFGEKELKQWYYPAKFVTEYGFEYKIPESYSVEKTIKYIKETIKSN